MTTNTADGEEARRAAADSEVGRVLSLATEWPIHGRLGSDVLATILDEVDLPARLFHVALAALSNAGITVHDVTDRSDVDDDGDGNDGNDEQGFDADGLSVFIARSRHELLSGPEEVALGERMERGRLAQLALEDAVPPEARRDLEHFVRDGAAAAEELARHNIRLVVSIAAKAHRHTSPALELEDLVQEGYFGLARAIDKWDHHRGLKFSTYATWWIRQTVSRAIADKGSTVRLPVHAFDALRKLLRTEREIASAGIRPTVARVAQRTGVPIKQAKELLEWRNGVDSLNRLVASGNAELYELLRGPDTSEPELLVEQLMLADAVDNAVRTLDPRERDIIRRRFGLDGRDGETLEEIGQCLGLTRERIRQIEAKAITKLRHPIRSQSLRDFVEV